MNRHNKTESTIFGFFFFFFFFFASRGSSELITHAKRLEQKPAFTHIGAGQNSPLLQVGIVILVAQVRNFNFFVIS